MRKILLRAVALLILAGLIFSTQFTGRSFNQPTVLEKETIPEYQPALEDQTIQEYRPIAENPTAGAVFTAAEENFQLLQTGTPIFRFPVVPGATISGYFDHQSAGGIVHHYNGRHNSPGAGFYFKCPSVYMNDWVGCEDVVSGEQSCANNREIWYDNHKGTDYEFAPNWHTKDICDPGKFEGLTMPIYAPARARVLMAGKDANNWANGYRIILQHDVNNNGNFNDDMLRSFYLHFTENTIAVWPTQIIDEGTYLGLGGTSGYSSSPHLHFEVKRSSDYFQSTSWSVDPYGWQGSGGDPWLYTNVNLFRLPPPVDLTESYFLPMIINQEQSCQNCGELLVNNGFESGAAGWDDIDPQLLDNIVVNTSYATLPIAPHGGSWLAWLGGRDGANTDEVNQTITIPYGSKSGVLRYYLYMTTEESGAAQDYFILRLRRLDGNVIHEIENLNNTFADRNHWVLRELHVPLESLQGQTVRMQIKGMTSPTNKTSFFIDDISLTVSD